MARRKHPDLDIEAAIAHAEAGGWRIKVGGRSSHAWGTMYCPHNSPSCHCGEFCITGIWSTPRNPQNHAKQLRRVVDRCTGGDDDE
ncbi:MAG: hypothetical protein ACYC5Q_15095 [Thermoleophilia bacterium]